MEVGAPGKRDGGDGQKKIPDHGPDGLNRGDKISSEYSHDRSENTDGCSVYAAESVDIACRTGGGFGLIEDEKKNAVAAGDES